VLWQPEKIKAAVVHASSTPRGARREFRFMGLRKSEFKAGVRSA
jgi:hypothetical protein